MARDWPGLVGMDLAKDVSLTQRMDWDETTWDWKDGLSRQAQRRTCTRSSPSTTA